jgi:hypothetical protein
MQTEKQRERLVELLNEANETVIGFTIDGDLERLADYLMSNNVVVLPCKVGDTVYCIWKYSDFAKEDIPFIQETRVISFVIEEGVPKIIPENYVEMSESWHQLIAVAFTKEEAENALKARERE